MIFNRAVWRVLWDRAAFRIAMRLPRRVAYMAYIRVMAASGRNPRDISFDQACAHWECGEGR